MARRLIAVGLASAALLAACSRGGGEPADTTTAPSTAPVPTTVPSGDAPAVPFDVTERARGGAARVGVSFAPDVDAPTLGGAAVRALVLPQLFVPRPDGRWAPWLVEAGSDRLAKDLMSASFRLRAAAWSDGAPITADDLRRTADTRFVAGVDGPDAAGVVTVRFTQELPAWRRLWSGADAIAPPRPGVYGGPFVVASATPGLETVLARNPGWPGPGPFLDEVRLVLVPDAVTMRQLFARGELDVISPPAATVRTGQLRAVSGAAVDVAARSGWWVALRLDPDGLDDATRRAVMATVPRARFAEVLLAGEATRLDGLAGPEDATWAGLDQGDASGLKGDTVDLVGMIEEPMTWLVHRAMQKHARAAGGTLELRQADGGRVERWLAEGSFDAAVVMEWDPPEVCWRCRFGWVDEGLAARADAGDIAAAVELERVLRDRALLVPLWRPSVAVASRGVDGVRANGYGLSAAWDAWAWSRAG